MNYKIVNIDSSENVNASVLIIYTGGTFGMAADEQGALKPFNFGNVVDKVPELKSLGLRIRVISFPKPIDSSNVTPDDWKDIAYIIEENYEKYDGFVVLHGTDTMAYSASALSFMLQGLNKPVIFTGAQIPIGSTRSDARENLITALEIASTKIDGEPRICEVCIYFNFVLLRANRSQKVNSSTFSAFHSENYPPLAESGIIIEYNEGALMPCHIHKLVIQNKMDTNVAILKLFPGIDISVVKAILGIKNLRGVVMETFGSGNTMTERWFIDELRSAIKSGLIIVNISQCIGGTVSHGKYATSVPLSEAGVLSGGDMTTEAATTKLMLLLGEEKSPEKVKEKIVIPMNGEMDE
ncbi:MAG: asparaginase [Cytophagales bacterium]|nr:asparaginase [Cytophagales bacterium]